MYETDCVVVGARAQAMAGREVVVLEREGLIGSHTSSRNSEVIHAGIYYPRGSAKARLCVAGRDRLYAYAGSRGVPHRRLGKIIVATEPGQVVALEGIAAAAAANGAGVLQPLSRTDLARLEPSLRGAAGLLSPMTGIIDSHALMLAYLGEAEEHGASLALRTRLVAAEPVGQGIRVMAESDGERVELRARSLVNAAGLFAGEVAAATLGLAPEHARAIFYCKGTYFSVARRVPFRHLVYPVPERDGLGVHLTLDMGGQGRFGPDTEWVSGLDYGLDTSRSAGFYAAIRSYWPDLPDDSLSPSYTGIRPKLFPEGGAATDFAIEGPEVHGVAGLVNLYGIESPGLTASLAIADEVVARLGQ